MNNRNSFRKATEDMCPYEHLYHATWLFNLERILKKGLLPKDNGSRNFMDCKIGVYLSNDPEIGVSCLETTENENIDDPDEEIKVVFAVKSNLVLPKLFVDSSYHFDDDPDDKIVSFRFDGIITPNDIDIVTHTGYSDWQNKIRETKAKIKAYQKENGGCHPYKELVGLQATQRNFRYSHIAYCLLRGRTIDQIEKPKEGNEPNMTYIKQVMEKYKEPIITEAETEAATEAAK